MSAHRLAFVVVETNLCLYAEATEDDNIPDLIQGYRLHWVKHCPWATTPTPP